MHRNSTLHVLGSLRQQITIARLFSSDAATNTALSTASTYNLPLHFPTICIWGANTGVGKTLFSAGLAASCVRFGIPIAYVKPVQTGFPTDSDARLVAAAAAGDHGGSNNLPVEYGSHAAALVQNGLDSSSGLMKNRQSFARTLFAWQAPVSPHLAVENEGREVSDKQLLQATFASLQSFAQQHAANTNNTSSDNLPLAIVETAGGVASPAPSGNLQCDVYKTLRAPGLLIGDGRLGGISTTLAAYELLLSRGHEVAAIAFMDPEGLGNEKIISRHVENGTLVIALPSCKPPPPLLSGTASNRPFVQRQQLDENLMKWLEQTHDSFDVLRSSIVQHHTSRVAALKNAADEGKSMLWWPFTQHGTLDAHRTSPKSTVTVVDARVGEHFIVLSDQQHSQNQNENENQQQLTQLYDACASWWTQGLSSSTQPLLTRSIAHAASRYGHIIFPQTVHQPALDLSKTLLNTVGKHWASRVFFTDDGSTAIEVALKMAFRKYMMDNKLLERGDVQLQVLGLKEAYHGDTLGAMDAVAPSVFNGRWQTPWFTGRGLFLDPPQLGIVNGTWKLLYDDGGNSDNEGGRLWSAIVSKTTESECLFNNRDDAFDVETRLQQQPALVELYKTHIDQLIIDHEQQHGKEANMQTKLGACIIEPLLQGAGGMRLLDPLYQRIMVDICRERGIPVIFDEVFSGLYRLGLPSAGHVLKTTPDVACFAKLLTGGTLPLAVTLATESIFDAFKGDEKAFALLHGHSYTAHPIGCAAAVRSLDVLSNPTTNPNTCTPSTSSASRCSCTAPCGKLKPLWDEPRITTDISTLPAVSRVVVLGTVLAVELHPTDAATGYHSNTAAAVVAQFRERGVYSRPLGNVVYVMVTPMSDKGQCDELLDVLESVLTGCLQS